MNSEPIQPVRTPLVGPEVQQTRAVPADPRKDRRRDRGRPKPRPEPAEETQQAEQADLQPGEDEEDAEGQHQIDVYT